MRLLRWLAPLVFLLLAGGVGWVYYQQRTAERTRKLPEPQVLPADTAAVAGEWEWVQENEHGVIVRVRARNLKELKDPPRLSLDFVELELRDPERAAFDLVRTARAELDQGSGILFAAGKVEILTGEGATDQDTRRRVRILTSGVRFDSKTGRAWTDEPSSFVFEQGEGRSVGAWYDPNTREIDMRSEVKIVWWGARAGDKSQPFVVEAGEAMYRERDSMILLMPWSRLRKGELQLHGGRTDVYVKDGQIRRIEAFDAQGTWRAARGRAVEFAANGLFVDLDADGKVERIHAGGKAKLRVVERSTLTSASAERVEMEFEVRGGESLLRTVRGYGQVEIESRASGAGEAAGGEVKVLRSDRVEIKMRPNGEEIELAQTHAPAVFELRPAAASRPSRRVECERLLASYGERNLIRSIVATGGVRTRTDFPRQPKKETPQTLFTSSRELKAEFATSKQGEVERIEQAGQFHFEQGSRRGWADRAILNELQAYMFLEGAARVEDESGTLEASRIQVDQKSQDWKAEGGVRSVRMPDPGAREGAILSDREPLRAQADRMISLHGRKILRYEGRATVWQGGNRLAAGWIEIDREKRELRAGEGVVCRFVEEAPADLKRPPVITVVKAPQMSYGDEEREAVFSGGVTLERGELEVNARRLRAILERKEGSTHLRKAYADGEVKIRHVSDDRLRQAEAEHAEYEVAGGVVVLYGGAPRFEDSMRGSARGRRITWYQEMDRLLVEGENEQPAASRLRREAQP